MADPVELVTERLVLRHHGVGDFADCVAMWADPAVTRHINSGTPFAVTDVWNRILRYAGHWALLGYGFWTVRERATERFVGEVGAMDFRREVDPPLVHPECGWILASTAHGKGYATEAMRAVLAWADARFACTTCMIDPDNAPSLRVAARLGYREVGHTSLGGKPVIVFERPRP